MASIFIIEFCWGDGGERQSDFILFGFDVLYSIIES